MEVSIKNQIRWRNNIGRSGSARGGTESGEGGGGDESFSRP